MILQFQIEVVSAKNISQLQCVCLGRIVVLFHQALRNGTCQAGRGSDESLMVFAQHGKVHTGFAIKAIHKRF